MYPILLTLFLVASDAGVDPEALALVTEEVERLLAADSFVGAELHILQDRRTVLHRAFGFADRDESRPMAVDSIFCVRSMTKPLVGTAVQMLLDEGRLSLDTKAAEILPAFDTPGKTGITIEHLLTHTSGLPFTTIGSPLRGYRTLGDVAAEAAGTPLLFRPGTSFRYSDAGSDTLGAIVAKITGEPVEEFLQERILDPLGMRDTLTLLVPKSPALARIPSAYSGNSGAWMRHWKPSDEPIFPLFLTSQSLYSTTSDYARFLGLWMDRGRGLLSPEAIDRGLTPREVLPAPSGFQGLQPFYGQQWTLHVNAETGEPEIFGHNGSDGTYAWAWPDRDLMVLFFTQTRGTLVGTELEAVLDRVLIRGDVEGYRAQLRTRAEAAQGFAPYEGLYWDETNRRAYYVVRAEGTRLMIERPGSFVRALLPTEIPGHYGLEGEPSARIQFEEPAEGVSEAFLFSTPGGTERQERHHPQADLPSVDEIVAGMHKAHGLDALEHLGAIRMAGKIDMPTRRMAGHVRLLFDARRSRQIATVTGASELVWITGDGRVFQRVNEAPIHELDGVLREQSILGHPLRRLGDWRADHASVEVLRTIEDGDHAVVLVRTISREGTGSTRLIDAHTGRLMAQDTFEVLPGVGRIGLKAAYGDYREVDGLMLPFRVQYQYAYPLIGEIHYTFETFETGVDAEGSLRPPRED